MRGREHDAVVVSNHVGTGHLSMDQIRQIMSDRCRHVLSPLQQQSIAVYNRGDFETLRDFCHEDIRLARGR